jgi:hypothetical protein
MQTDAPKWTISNGCSERALKHVRLSSVEIHLWYEPIFVLEMSMKPFWGDGTGKIVFA